MTIFKYFKLSTLCTFFCIPPIFLLAQQDLSSSTFPSRPERSAFSPLVPISLPPIISARSAILFDAHTGKIIFKYNETEPRPVASTQKLLTALIIVESGDLDKPIVIEKSDTIVSPTKIGIRSGEIYTRRELLTVMLVKSANDAAVVLARDNAGSVSQFAEKMNHRMAELMGTSSHFENPSGLPIDNQYSTARDMAIIARAAYANPIIREIVNYRTLPFRFNNGRTTVIQNTNHLLLDYTFCNGMKTGYTDKAGHCLVASGSWEGKDAIAIILGERARSGIWKDGQSLLIYGLGLYPDQVAACRIFKSSTPQKKRTSSASKPRKRTPHKRPI